jgi:hypothetical protein
MRADLRPTKENIVAVGWILLLTFGAVLIILAVCVYQWRQNNLRYSEFMAREKPLSDSFHTVYQKLIGDKSSNPAAAFIRSGDIRRALARGPNELGELPPWVANSGVYISRADVPVNSGRFLCFVRANDTNAPYGLTSAGECRNADPAEIFPADFVSLRSQ